jgi:hypothetical protein
LETSESLRFAGQTVTLSFYARAGANFSGASNTFSAYIYTGTGTDQPWTSFTGQALISATNFTLTTSWQRFSTTFTVGSTATEIGFYLAYTPSGTAGSNDYYDLTGVQMEVGSVATPFSRAGGTLQGELAACQRYYYLHATGNSTNPVPIGVGSSYTSTNVSVIVPLKVNMRTAPTLDHTTGANYYAGYRNGGIASFNSFTIDTASTQAVYMYNNSQYTATAGQSVNVTTNSSSATLAFSAEL